LLQTPAQVVAPPGRQALPDWQQSPATQAGARQQTAARQQTTAQVVAPAQQQPVVAPAAVSNIAPAGSSTSTVIELSVCRMKHKEL